MPGNKNSKPKEQKVKSSECVKDIDCSKENKDRKIPTKIPERVIEKVIAIWKAAFPDTAVLIRDPKGKWFVFTHTLAGNTLGIDDTIPRIDGVAWQNPLNINALGSVEIRDGKIGNFYETILHDVPGLAGVRESSTAVYVNTLNKLGIYTDGDHYHWKGHCEAHHAIHDHSFDLSPTEFSRRSIEAYKAYSKAAQENLCDPVCGVEKTSKRE